MTRVKMNAKHEYEFIANFKVLQNFFKSKKIEKVRLFARLFGSRLSDSVLTSVCLARPSGEAREMQDAVRPNLYLYSKDTEIISGIISNSYNG